VTNGAGRVSGISTSGVQYTIAGSGPLRGARPPIDGLATEAQFGYLLGITAADDGTIFVADASNRRIRLIEGE